MKKNQKIMAAVAAIIVVVVLIVVMISTKNTNEETSNSNVETSESIATEESTKVESSTEVIASIGTAPEDSQSSIDKSSAINFPGDETSSTSEIETSDSSTSESSTTENSTSKTESTTESSTSKTESTTESSSSKTETSTSESSTSENSKTETSTSVTNTTEPTTSESSTTPEAPVDNSSSSTPAPSEQITQGSTGTTSLGTTYPIVSEFNKVALNPNATNFFSTSDYGSEFAKAFGQGNRAISDVLGYPSTQIAIEVANSYIAYGNAYISRDTDKGYYLWSYTADVTISADTSRAVHQVMLGAITSTPVEVENALFQAMWGDDPYNIGSNQWVTVGDCKIFYNYGDFENFTFEFLIKPAN